MSDCNFVYENAEYSIIDDRFAVFNHIKEKCSEFVVPSEVFSKKKYIIKGVSIIKHLYLLNKKMTDVLSFAKTTDIDVVPTSIILSCQSVFYLPSTIKRVRSDAGINENSPSIIYDKSNRFVSILAHRNIINHFPLELLFQCLKRPQLSIRETVRIIGKDSFGENQRLITLIIPPSVEVIGNFAFHNCSKLKIVTFRGNSRLKRIGTSSFRSTLINNIKFPATLEEIGDYAFESCSMLASISFPNDSKLRVIGNSAFMETKLENITFPSKVEEIRLNTFKGCKELKTIRFPNNSLLKSIGRGAFRETAIKSVDFPSSVEMMLNL